MEIENEVNCEQIESEKMTVVSLIEYCHTAANQLEVLILQMNTSLTGEEIAPKVHKQTSGVFNSCVGLADKLIYFKELIGTLNGLIV